MSGRATRIGLLGVCGCRQNQGDWQRPRHWTLPEVAYLEEHYGRVSDLKIAARLGRSVEGIHIKAKRLGQRKRDAGLTAAEVARAFAVDGHVPIRWWKAGLIKAQRAAFRQGGGQVLLFQPLAVERFIREHGEYVDVEKMAEGAWRDLASRPEHRWYSLVDVERLTGHDPKSLTVSLRAGVYAGRKRWGCWWMVPAAELPRIAARTTRWRRTHLDGLQLERTRRLRERKRRRVLAA